MELRHLEGAGRRLGVEVACSPFLILLTWTLGPQTAAQSFLDRLCPDGPSILEAQDGMGPIFYQLFQTQEQTLISGLEQRE